MVIHCSNTLLLFDDEAIKLTPIIGYVNQKNFGSIAFKALRMA